MNSDRKIHNVDISKIDQQGKINIFEQSKILKDAEGLCAPMNTSILKKLFAGQQASVEKYADPLPKELHNDILQQERTMIDLGKDGNNMNHAPFLPFYKSEEIGTKCINHNEITTELKQVQAATLTYKTKQGIDHQVAFYRFNSDECYIVDANRLVSIQTNVDESLNVLQKIVERSNPSVVEMTSVPIKPLDFTENPITIPPSNDEIKQPSTSIEKMDEENAKNNFDTIKNAFIQNFISSFIATFSGEMADNDQMEKNTLGQINYTEQMIHALALIATGDISVINFAKPIAHYLLVKYFNMSETNANYCITAMTLIATAINNPRELKNIAMTMAASMAANSLGEYTAKECYKLLKQGFFAPDQSSPVSTTCEEKKVETYDYSAIDETDEDESKQSSYDDDYRPFV